MCDPLDGEALAAAKNIFGPGIVTNITLFDVYRSDQIGKGKKSLAYSLTYQSADKTLTDNDVSQIRLRIIRKLDQDLGAKLRT